MKRSGNRRNRSLLPKAPEVRGLTLSTRIALEIADQILEGRRAPGSHLNEQALAEEFGVSRTPIREAIRHLGIVDKA